MTKTTVPLILMLGFPYSAILVFSAFGPVMYRIVEPVTAALMSTAFLAILASAMIPDRFAFERTRAYLPAAAAAGAIGISVFAIVPSPVRWPLLVVFALVLGRVAVAWSRLFLIHVSRHRRGRVVGWSLCVAYGILYLANVGAAAVPPAVLPIFVGALLLLSVPFGGRLPRSLGFFDDWDDADRGGYPRLFVGVVFMVYLTAGFTYAGMFPDFASMAPLDRYYNVLPFVFVVPFAGYLADRYGRLLLLYVGVAAVGGALAFFQLRPSVGRYLLSQTSVQVGWAFLDAYVWVVGADLAFDRKRRRFQNIAVATFLIGTVVGSSLTLVFFATGAGRHHFLWFLPLFVAIALMSRLIYDRAQPVVETHDELPDAITNSLTERQEEIALMLVAGAKNPEICDELHISLNTLKTHCRNIYRKLGVDNRLELRELTRGRRDVPYA